LGLKKAQTSMEGSSGEYWTMGESLIQQYHMRDEGFSRKHGEQIGFGTQVVHAVNYEC
jgi:hypothetical protein